MKSQSVLQRTLGFLGSKAIIVEPSGAMLTSDAGLLPIREFDEALGFTRQFAEALHDTRDARYQTRSWPHPRRTIVKCEANAADTNRRVVVTNRPGASLLPGTAYDDYADRGESENRNKELKCGLSTDRLSDHRIMANLFRLFLHVQAHNGAEIKPGFIVTRRVSFEVALLTAITTGP